MELVGTVIKGQYAVREILGAGGMGTVFRGEQLSVERPVAIKVMRPEFAQDEAAVKRFQREAKLTSRLSHPNTIRLFDFGFTDDGLMFLVMELLDGRELADEVKMTGAIPVARAIKLTLQIGLALRAAHKLGIVHRDLKPSNVFLARGDGGGELLKVMDFGIAKSVDDKAATQVTQAGTIVGTPAYMSPEQAKGIAISANSDIYSLGIILYELLTGSVPFTSESMIRVLMMHVTNEPPPLAETRPELADIPDLQETIDKMLIKDPARRPDSVAACKMLEGLLAGPAGKMVTVKAPLRVAKTVEIDGAGADEATAFVDAAPDTVIDDAPGYRSRASGHHVQVDGVAEDDATAFVDAVDEATAAGVPQAGGKPVSVQIDGIGSDDATAFVDSVDESTAAVPAAASVQIDGVGTDDATAFVDSVDERTATATAAVRPAPARKRSGRAPRRKPSARHVDRRPPAPPPASTQPAAAKDEVATVVGPVPVEPTAVAAPAVGSEPAKSSSKMPLIAGAAVLLLAAIGAAVGLSGGDKKAEGAKPEAVDPAEKADPAEPAAKQPAKKPENTAAAAPEPAKEPEKPAAPAAAVAKPEPPQLDPAKPDPAKPEPAKPAAEPTLPPRIPILSKPLGADVIIDGKSVGKTPTSIPRPAAGTTVAIDLKLAHHKDGQATIAADLKDPVIVTLEALPRPKKRRKKRRKKKRARDQDLMMD